MAASQCARYVHNPKRSHELALIQIGRYLKGTLDKGLIFTPIDAESLRTDVYVDALPSRVVGEPSLEQIRTVLNHELDTLLKSQIVQSSGY